MGQGTQAGNPADRRTTERVPARVEVRFADSGQAARALRAYSLNFSAGGLCLRTRRSYEVGATLSLEIDVAGESYAFFGTVAWVRDGAIGVRFENVAPNDRSRLEALVASFKA